MNTFAFRLFFGIFFIRRGLAAYQKNGCHLNYIFRSIDVSLYVEEEDADFKKKVSMNLLRDEMDKRLPLSGQGSARFDWERSLFLIHLKVATYNFSTSCFRKQTTATSDTPTASGCRQFRATSLSPLSLVLEQV